MDIPEDAIRPLVAVVLTLLLLLPAACDEKKKNVRDDEAVKVVVAADRKLAEEETSLLANRGKLQRERVRLQDQRANLLTRKLTEEDPSAREKIEDEESKLVKLEQRLVKQEMQLNKKLESLVERKGSLVNQAKSSGAQVKALLLARREHSLASREKTLAQRETDVARREKLLAERERSFAVRQARLCPGRVTTVVQAAPAPRRSGNYSRADVEPVYKAALSTMRRKGIRVADLPAGIDRMVRDIRHAVSNGKYTKAKYAADQLLGAVRAIRIDRAFIGAKIGRLSAATRRRPPKSGRKAKVAQLFQLATADYGDGRFAAANKKLNRIYGLLR